MLIHQLLEDSARRDATATAIIHGERRISYGDLDALANRYANVFHAAGIARGARVLLAVENSITWVAAYFGVLKAGAIAVPLPSGPRSDRLGAAVGNCAPSAAVVDLPTFRDAGNKLALSGVPTIWVSDARCSAAPPDTPACRTLSEEVARASDARPALPTIDRDLAAIVYTSGSTGAPRGVMLTHRNFVANARSIVAYLELGATDRVMCVLPFYYVYGLSLLHTHLAVGGSLVIDNRFAFPNVVLRGMQDNAVSGFAGVPSTFALLLHRSDLESIAVPSLRYVTQAGGAMAPERIREWCARGPRVPFYVMYGATEAAARLTYLDPSRLQDKLGSIGRAIPNVEVFIVNADGKRARIGEVGEVVARGANISPGYWNDPEATRERFGPFGYRTGDFGYVDGDGYVYLVGRRQDMLKVGAHRVGAKEIEDVIQELPSIDEVAVVGGSHDLLGEVPVAFISFRPAATDTAENVLAFCRSRLAAHKVPARVVILHALPKLGTVGKIDKVRLREAAGKPAATAATT